MERTETGDPRALDVIGVGANSVDHVYSLPTFPRPDSAASKLRISAHRLSCGGQTATTLCACAALGLRTAYVGTTGNDANGELIRNELAARGVHIGHALIRPTSNPFAVILIDEAQGERVVLWDRGPGLDLQRDEIDSTPLTSARLVHVDDADEDAAIHAAAIARRAGVPVTSDIERVTSRTRELVAAVTIPIFAEHALEPFTGERDVERALRAVQSLCRERGDAPLPGAPTSSSIEPGDLVCVTLGARGAVLLAGDALHVAAGHQVDVVDTTGAGDVFRGAFIAAFLRGDSPLEILRFANAAAALSCTRAGAIASVPTAENVRRLAGL